MNHIISFLLLASLVGCHAQSTVNVYIQDSVQCPSGYFSTHFIGVKLDGSTGLATVNFIGGDNADNNYVLSLETTDQTSSIAWDTTIPITMSATGTYWIYLAEVFTTSNWDWIEIRVVSSTFSGTINALYGSAPSGWTSGYPPFYVPMVSIAGPHPNPPASQPAPTSISKILVPILVVVIVLAISIPAGVYIYRRRQAKKMMAAQGSTPETSTVQMNSVLV